MEAVNAGTSRFEHVSEERVPAAGAFEVSDELWTELRPMLPVVPRRRRHPGRKRLCDQDVLNGILFVLYTGIAWQDLPQELGYGSGVTCWRRLREWQQAGVWEPVQAHLVRRIPTAGQIDWSRAAADSTHISSLLGGTVRVQTPAR